MSILTPTARDVSSINRSVNMGSDSVQYDGVKNANYRITIKKGSESVSTPMPDNWSTNLDITWSPQFANVMQSVAGALMGAGTSEAVNNALALGGYTPQNKTLSAQIWQGTSYVTLNIPFIFKVERDSKAELIDPIKKLMRMALPSEDKLMLKAPYSPFVTNETVSSILGANTQPVQVAFGRFFFLDNCVITNISQSYDSIFDSAGMPLSAKVDVSVTSTYIIVASDIDKLIPG